MSEVITINPFLYKISEEAIEILASEYFGHVLDAVGAETHIEFSAQTITTEYPKGGPEEPTIEKISAKALSAGFKVALENFKQNN